MADTDENQDENIESADSVSETKAADLNPELDNETDSGSEVADAPEDSTVTLADSKDVANAADVSTEKPDQENNKSDAAKGDASKDKQSSPADSEVNSSEESPAESKQEVPKTDRQIGPEDLEILEASQENSDEKPSESLGKAVEIEGGGSVDDGTVKLKINGVNVGPLTHIDRTLAVTSEQIKKAKTLIYVTSAITGFVLVVSILFYVALSVQLSQKTTELDRMLLAVAKRGIQLGDGIERIADVENYLLDLQNNQSLLKTDVGKLDETGQSLDQKLAKTEAMLLDTFSKEVASTRDIEEKNIKSLLSELASLKRNQQELSKLGKIDKNQEKISLELRKLESRMLEMQAKVNDLYIIRQAELNAALKVD